MKFERKNPGINLRKYYSVFLQSGVIFVLLLFIVATKVDIRSADREIDFTDVQEVTEIEDIVQTTHDEKPATPPKPIAPVEVPNNEPIEAEPLDFSADWSTSTPGKIPEPADNKEEVTENFFVAVEQMPKLIGGLAKLQQKINYPERAKQAGIDGRVTIQFIVTEQGTVEDPKVIRGIGGGCDEEALRVVKKAKFKPGLQRGKPVRVQYSIPILFRLQN
ncbi:energy transducer TonB [Fodinibius salsisoli]|uniref:Energy transducer TonB n=1 Tax=Fodinibius salsisoli TaxID=2820877 RepID=A0ABT3PPT6_9BACT|nr:energy transducer TonB [Fodinibius salsisoli]MCW9707873.1 energy transducer TonB [Fodinibius salsisoli]